MSKTDSKAAKPNEDVMPDSQDDGGELLNAEQVSQDTSGSGGGETSANERPAEEQPEDPRAAIARKYRENRDRARAAESGADDQAEPEEPEAVAEDVTPQSDTAAATASQQNNEQEITLKVDGREVKKSMSEVIALAQQTVAGDNRLEETKRLLREAQALRGQPKETEHKPDPDGDEEITQQHDRSQGRSAGEHQPRRELDPEKLKGIVERIQVGDTDEGTQALQDLIEVVRGSGELNPEKIGEMVQQHIVRTQTQAEIDSALASFVKDFPDLAKDEVLADAGRTVLRQELIKDLKAVGASDAEIDKIKHDPRALAAAQRELRVAGHGVRSYADILGAVGKTMTDRFNIKPASQKTSEQPKPQVREPAPSQDRLDRKRAAPQQPRAAGVRSQIASPPQPKTKKDVVADMRKARGFSTLS